MIRFKFMINQIRYKSQIHDEIHIHANTSFNLVLIICNIKQCICLFLSGNVNKENIVDNFIVFSFWTIDTCVK